LRQRVSARRRVRSSVSRHREGDKRRLLQNCKPTAAHAPRGQDVHLLGTRWRQEALIGVELVPHHTMEVSGPPYTRPLSHRQPTIQPEALLNRQLAGTSAGFWLGESMPPCRPRRRKFEYEMVHSEVYLNKYAVSIALFSTHACPDYSQNIYHKHRKLLFFACFRCLIFFIFPGSQLTPFAPMCGRPWQLGLPKIGPNSYNLRLLLVASPLIIGYDATALSNGESLASPAAPLHVFCHPSPSSTTRRI